MEPEPGSGLCCLARIDLVTPGQVAWLFGCQGDFRAKAGGLSGCPGFCARGHLLRCCQACCPSSWGPGWSRVGAPPASLGLLRGRGLLSHLQRWLQGWRGLGRPLPVPRGAVHLALQAPCGTLPAPGDSALPRLTRPGVKRGARLPGPRRGSSSPCPARDPSAAAALTGLTQARAPGTPGHVAAGAPGQRALVSWLPPWSPAAWASAVLAPLAAMAKAAFSWKLVSVPGPSPSPRWGGELHGSSLQG